MLAAADLGTFLAARGSRLACVLFDLDGTLRYNVPSATTALFDRAVGMGVLDGDEKRRRIARWTHYYWAQSSELAQDLAAFPQERDFWLNYTIRSLLEFDCQPECARELAPELVRHMHEEYQSENVVPPDVRPTLERLKKAGYRLALLSNRDEPCHEELNEWGLDEYFELALVAGQVSAWKPDPGLFIHALECLGVPAQSAIYIGDNYYADVVGARRAGVHPVLYDPEGVFPNANCVVIRRIGELNLLAEIR